MHTWSRCRKLVDVGVEVSGVRPCLTALVSSVSKIMAISQNKEQGEVNDYKEIEWLGPDCEPGHLGSHPRSPT